MSPAGSALGPSGPPRLPLAVHLLPHCPLSPGLLSARSTGPCTPLALLSIRRDWGPPGDRTHGSASALGRGDALGLRPGLQQGVGPGHCSHGAPFLGPSNTLAPLASLKKTSAGVTDVLRLPMSVWAGSQGWGLRVPGTRQLACAYTCLWAVGGPHGGLRPSQPPALSVPWSPAPHLLCCSAERGSWILNRVAPRVPVATEPRRLLPSASACPGWPLTFPGRV